jgi:hypothetical protein
MNIEEFENNNYDGDFAIKSRNGCSRPPDYNSPVYNDMKRICKGCPYARHGFACYDNEGGCIKTYMDSISAKTALQNRKAKIERKR